MQQIPPPLPKPKRVYVYIALLFGLPLLYIFGGISSSNSAHPIIRELQALRWFVFVLCALCYTMAGVLFLKRQGTGRLLIIFALLAHFAYMLEHNRRLLFESGSAEPIETIGFVFGLVTFLGCFLVFRGIPFTRKFSLYFAAKT